MDKKLLRYSSESMRIILKSRTAQRAITIFIPPFFLAALHYAINSTFAVIVNYLAQHRPKGPSDGNSTRVCGSFEALESTHSV